MTLLTEAFVAWQHRGDKKGIEIRGATLSIRVFYLVEPVERTLARIFHVAI